MNPEDVSKLLKLSEENNILLKKIRRGQLIQTWIRATYFILLLAFAYGGYLFIKPYLQGALTTYTNFFSI